MAPGRNLCGTGTNTWPAMPDGPVSQAPGSRALPDETHAAGLPWPDPEDYQKVVLTTVERLLSTPPAVYAEIAKYQVPDERLLTM